jgi:hypothetical protein
VGEFKYMALVGWRVGVCKVAPGEVSGSQRLYEITEILSDVSHPTQVGETFNAGTHISGVHVFDTQAEAEACVIDHLDHEYEMEMRVVQTSGHKSAMRLHAMETCEKLVEKKKKLRSDLKEKLL